MRASGPHWLCVLIAAGLVGITPVAQAQTHHNVGPTYLYPDPAVTPGVANPDITQGSIDQTIYNPNWSTKTIRPPASYTNTLKQQHLAASKFKDKRPWHYEEDYFTVLELGA